jgi:hypothetical protein
VSADHFKARGASGLVAFSVALAAVTVSVCLLRVHDNDCRGARDQDERESNKGKKT